LQLQVIERGIELWSNPGDLVLSPFGGIGSEPVTAVKMGRRAIAVELKRSYWEVAVKNLRDARKGTMDLFENVA
jgi:DNA modification methylase